jgi:hypothetical protein
MQGLFQVLLQALEMGLRVAVHSGLTHSPLLLPLKPTCGARGPAGVNVIVPKNKNNGGKKVSSNPPFWLYVLQIKIRHSFTGYPPFESY